MTLQREQGDEKEDPVIEAVSSDEIQVGQIPGYSSEY